MVWGFFRRRTKDPYVRRLRPYFWADMHHLFKGPRVERGELNLIRHYANSPMDAHEMETYFLGVLGVKVAETNGGHEGGMRDGNANQLG